MKKAKKYHWTDAKKAAAWFMKGGWVVDGDGEKVRCLGRIKGSIVTLYWWKDNEYAVGAMSFNKSFSPFMYAKGSQWKITTPPPGGSNLELALEWSPQHEPKQVPTNPRTQAGKKARGAKAKPASRKTGSSVRQGKRTKGQ